MAQERSRLRFVLNERKAAQAAAVLLKAHGQPMTKLMLVKLLYLAERESLTRSGRPITGDRLVSMNHGPVLSGVLDAINSLPSEPPRRRVWSEYVSELTGNEVRLQTPEPKTDELSRFELDVLAETYGEFGKKSIGAILHYCHALPEWRDPHGSSLDIDPADILRFDGWADDEIDAVADDAEEDIALQRVLASSW